MRLNRYLAACGLGSRRSCEQIVAEGRVFINGEEVRALATQVGDADEVIVDGRKMKAHVDTTVILNKPPGFLCTRHDELEDPRREPGIRETVYKLLPDHLQSLHYVGRLDKDSEGLLILTNSGELTEKLTHPRFGVEKEYLIAVDRVFRGEEDRDQLLKGMMIEGGFAKAVAVEQIEPRVVALTLTQGIKRQIRLMFEAIGYRVQRLQRVRIGAFTAPELRSGRWRILSAAETAQLLARHTVIKARPAQARAVQRKVALGSGGSQLDAHAPLPPRDPRPTGPRPIRAERDERGPSREARPSGPRPFRDERAPSREARPGGPRSFRDERAPSREARPGGSRPFRDERAPSREARPSGPRPFRDERAPSREARPGGSRPFRDERAPSREARPGGSRPFRDERPARKSPPRGPR